MKRTEENHEIYSLNKPFDFLNLSRLTTNTLGKNKRNSGNRLVTIKTTKETKKR